MLFNRQFNVYTTPPPLLYKQNELHDWPLILAAGSGHLELVQQLHEFGGHVTRRHTLSRCTPLHVAARGGHMGVVRFVAMPMNQALAKIHVLIN